MNSGQACNKKPSFLQNQQGEGDACPAHSREMLVKHLQLAERERERRHMEEEGVVVVGGKIN